MIRPTILLTFLLLSFAGFSQKKKLQLKLEKAPKFSFTEYDFVKESIAVSEEELKLYNLINKFRNDHGKDSIALSKSLTFVAQTHVRDLKFNVKENKRCTMHSWSKKGPWISCCYSRDHSTAECMWNKPRELTDYYGNGYELVYWHSWDPTAEQTIAKWRKNKTYLAVLLNIEGWKNDNWKSIGVGIYEEYAVVWLGRQLDKDGSPNID